MIKVFLSFSAINRLCSLDLNIRTSPALPTLSRNCLILAFVSLSGPFLSLSASFDVRMRRVLENTQPNLLSSFRLSNALPSK